MKVLQSEAEENLSISIDSRNKFEQENLIQPF